MHNWPCSSPPCFALSLSIFAIESDCVCLFTCVNVCPLSNLTLFWLEEFAPDSWGQTGTSSWGAAHTCLFLTVEPFTSSLGSSRVNCGGKFCPHSPFLFITTYFALWLSISMASVACLCRLDFGKHRDSIVKSSSQGFFFSACSTMGDSTFLFLIAVRCSRPLSKRVWLDSPM